MDVLNFLAIGKLFRILPPTRHPIHLTVSSVRLDLRSEQTCNFYSVFTANFCISDCYDASSKGHRPGLLRVLRSTLFTLVNFSLHLRNFVMSGSRMRNLHVLQVNMLKNQRSSLFRPNQVLNTLLIQTVKLSLQRLSHERYQRIHCLCGSFKQSDPYCWA